MKIYCQKCGAKVEYSASNKPKFCHNCGSSLSLGSNVGRDSQHEEPLEEEESDATSVPNIQELEVDIQTESASTETIGDLALQQVEENTNPIQYPTPKSLKGESLKELKKEAGSLRKKGSTNET